MSTLLYVGIDIAKASFVAAVWQGTKGVVLGEYDNTPSGFDQLCQKLEANYGKDRQIFLVLEATGGYELGILAYAETQGWQVSLPNPRAVRAWAEGIGRRAKTDSQDSLSLAQYGAEKKPEPQDALSDTIQELSELLQRREDLKKLRRSESNRLGTFQHRPRPSQAVIDSLHHMLASIDAELDAIDQAIKDLINGDPDLKADVKRLRTVPGIGPKNSLPILLQLHRFRARTQGQGSCKGIVAFTGLDPQPHESGRTVYKRATISKMGNRSCRSLLYMGALGGIRAKNSPLRFFYQRLVNRGKAKRLALVAAARKILVWAWCVFTRQVDFDPSMHPTPST